MTAAAQQAVSCPKCGGQMWDNRAGKTNPKAPDFKCKDRACDGVIWPPRRARQQPAPAAAPVELGHLPGVPMASEQQPAPATTPQERLDKLANLQAACFKRAMALAEQASAKGYVVTLEGVSALTAQLFIAFKEGR
jgi:hypothetical protein